MAYTVGNYLADRLEEIGVRHYFTVPGDFNLVLLDQMLANRNLELINCCNELNAAYAAEGYARGKGVGALVVTYNVGAFSALNGVAGAYAERLPLIFISGGYNTNDLGADLTVHHTLDALDLSYQYAIIQRVTCDAAWILHAREAPDLIDRVIHTVMRERKPGYIEIPSNLAGAECFRPTPFPSIGTQPAGDPSALAAAVDAAADALAKAERPVLLAGMHLRSYGGTAAFRDLADALGCAVAVQPNAKGLFSEESPQFIGIYWGSESSPGCQEIIDWSDLVVAAGPVYSDYTTVGWTAEPPSGRTIHVDKWTVHLPDADYTGITMAEFLSTLAKKVEKNDTSLVQFRRTERKEEPVRPEDPDGPLSRKEMVRQVHGLVDSGTTLVVDSGDSWFNTVYLSLPEGARYEMEMQWGSIGWSVPASFGYALGVKGERRVVTMVGDGAFQLTAQEVANMIRYKSRNIIILVNNHGYISESAIHEGPYNYIKNWDYAGLVENWNAGDGQGIGLLASTGRELAGALEKARDHLDGPVLIECQIPHSDYSAELMEWGKKVSHANARPPRKE